MMSCSRATSSFGQYTGAPVAFASGATAPTWATSVCVIRIASTVAPSFSMAPVSSSGSSPGSISSARSEPSARRMNVFSWNGPTVKARTSTTLLAPAALRRPLTAVVEERVGVVADRDVEQQHEATERDRLGDRLLEEEHDDGDEEQRRDQRAVRRALPAGGLAEAVGAPAAGGLLALLLALLGTRRTARAAAVLDDPRGVAAVLGASLALRLGHRGRQGS